MQLKWKCIISNWINCYFYDNNNKHETPVNQELLFNIINHLRQNFNLDESKSSIFTGQTLEEFIAEKFPGFVFENGTLQVITEEDIFIAASLLLFFVCVNSKDVNLKSAMCSKLSASDQEVILKFSKTLMECSKISSLDVISAITEACGPGMSTGEGCSRVLVAETPPALRSLHGEVRRLQAALDAERFDRNYLQEELARTNLKLEKLVKDKEQYKIDIVNLKAKISMCCGQETEARGGEMESNEMNKLTKQLQQMEQRLVDVQEELEEVKHERDTLKTKLENLKCECDRLIVLNQQETSQATQLAEELENERRLSQSLRELVVELRQHNQRNGLDSSMLECDDPDTSVQSLQRSFSVCTDVCANVVEVQLGEERAKIQSLRQEIQLLQDECNEQLQNANKFKKIISDKENEIFNLKHRINEEIEDKNNLKCFLDNEITKLNNIVNELEQKLQNHSEQSKLVIATHMQEIQTLQEEKMSLIQSLSDQARKSDNQIKELKEEIDAEKVSKTNMRDDYENHVMKLKEKVLNRNNELVELQNKILQKSEVIEEMSLELRKEKELKDAKIKEFTNDLAVLNGQKVKIEKDLQDKCLEITELMNEIHKRDVYIDNLNKDLECFKISAANMKEEYRVLEEANQSLLDDVQNRQVSADKMRKELDNLRQLHSEEKDKLQCKLDEMCAMVKSLQTQLQNEIDFKLGLQHELEKTQGVITKLSNTNTKLNTELTETALKMQGIDEIIQKQDVILHEEQEKYSNLEQHFDKLKTNMENVSSENLQKSQIIKEYEKLIKSLQEEITKNNERTITLHTEFASVNEEKLSLQTFIESLRNEKDEIIKEKDLLLHEEKETHGVLKKEYDSIKSNMEKLSSELTLKDQIIQKCNTKLDQVNKSFRNEITKSDEIIDSLNKDLARANAEKQSLQDAMKSLTNEKNEILRKEKEIYSKFKQDEEIIKKDLEKVSGELMLKDTLLREYEDKLTNLNSYCQKEISKYIERIDMLNQDLTNVNAQKQSLQEVIHSITQEKDAVIKENDLLLQVEKEIHIKLQEENDKFHKDMEKLTAESLQKDTIIQKCENELRHLNTYLQDEINKNTQIIASMNRDLECVNDEKDSLHKTIVSLNEEKNNLIKIVNEKSNFISELEAERESLSRKMEEKGATIHGLEQKLKDKMLGFMEIENNFGIEISKLMTKLSDTEKTFKDIKIKSNSIIENQELQIQSLNGELFTLKGKLESSLKEIAKLEKNLKEINMKYDKMEKDYENKCQSLEDAINMLRNEIALKEKGISDLNKKNTLISSLVAEQEKELSILRDANNEWNCKKDFMNDNIKKEQKRLSETVEELNTKNAELNGELKVKSLTIHNLEEEIKARNNNMATLEKEKSLYKALLVELEKEGDNLNSKNKNLESENKELLEGKSILESNLMTLKTNFDELNTNLIKIEEEKIEMLNEVERVKSELKKIEKYYENELEVKEKLCESIELEKLKLINDCSLLQDNCNDAVLELEKKKSEINTLRDELNNTNNKIYGLEETDRRKEMFLVQLKQEKEKLEVEKEDLIKERDLILLRIANLEHENEALQNEVLPKLKGDNLRLTKLVNEDKTVITNLEKLVKEKSEQIDQMRQNYDTDKVALTNKCHLLQEKLEQAELKLDRGSAEINELKKELEICTSVAKEREDESKQNYKILIEKCEEKEMKIRKLIQELEEATVAMSQCQQELQSKEIRILEIKQRLSIAENEKREVLQNENLHFTEILRKKDEECALLRNENNEWKIKMDALEAEFVGEKNALRNELKVQVTKNDKLEKDHELISQHTTELNKKLHIYDSERTELQKQITDVRKENERILCDKNVLIQENNNNIAKLNDLQKEYDDLQSELAKMKKDNLQLKNIIETYESEIMTLEKIINKEIKQNEFLFKETIENLELSSKCKIFQEFNTRIKQVLEQRRMEMNALREEIKIVTADAKAYEIDLKQKNEMLTKILEEKDDVILKINEELSKEKILNGEYQKQVQLHENDISKLEKKLSQLKDDVDRQDCLRNENNLRKIELNDANIVQTCEGQQPREQGNRRDPDSQVHSPSSDIAHSATEKNKIITDLERILKDKNRTISNLNSDITYLKSLMAESESEVLDKTKELEMSRENFQQLSLQLKKIVHQKNEEIMDLKKQVTKMSLTENRASQIIKVSARYQEIIQKRIAEIKSDTALKELTNFGNSANGDLKRSLNSGAITMEDLENFLETTDKHLRRCSEKRAALQKERDRLLEVNRINESDIINIKKFLTELSVSVKTFNSYKEMYTQKLSRVILLQRTVRREILKVEERLSDEAKCKLERTYAAVMQDLVECAMNLERWVERCVARAISSEKIKQAFMSDLDRASLTPATFQSAALEVQIDELENSFQKVLEEVARALKGEGGRPAAAGGGTVAEVRAEYEDKLTRMKAKMKELYSQEIEVFKEKQRREIECVERELARSRARLAETSGAYEEHIRGLTSELWRLGERLVERDEERPARAPRAPRAPSLMSLQQMPSLGAAAHAEDQSRASDTHSLRSLPLNINKKKEGRGLHMSDEEGEVFDNRYLRELRSPGAAAAGRASELATPRGDPSLRLSELRWRNSLCLPHLKSSYPAETQFVVAHEDDIKAVPANASVGGRQQRKEVGITAYKKPGPPTPSKQAGRLSATDSELRESLRVEAEPQGAGGGAAGRRTATPSRLRALFTSNRSDAVDGTPRSRRLSNFFRKK